MSNTLQLTAIVELLEERGIMTQRDVVERMKVVRNRMFLELSSWGCVPRQPRLAIRKL
jgi:hypothetical protein